MFFSAVAGQDRVRLRLPRTIADETKLSSVPVRKFVNLHRLTPETSGDRKEARA